MRNAELFADIVFQIRRERDRQEELKKTGRFDFTCSDPGITNAGRLAVLAEEVGEVAHEVNEGIGLQSSARYVDLVKLRKELIEVAAVTVAWIEAIDSGAAKSTSDTANFEPRRLQRDNPVLRSDDDDE